ncbi:MAG TPA: hypothetical protein VGE32_16910 [Cellvibrio sp.]
MEIWQAILAAFGGTALLFAVLAFCGKSLVSHWLSKSATEHQIKFSSFSEKQAEAIANTYALARKFNLRLKEYLEIPDFTSGTRAERQREVASSHREFLDYFEQKQIYLSKKSVGLLNNVNSESKKIFNEFLYQIQNTPDTPETAQQWLKLHERLQEDLEKLFVELELEFRQIVGNKS